MVRTFKAKVNDVVLDNVVEVFRLGNTLELYTADEKTYCATFNKDEFNVEEFISKLTNQLHGGGVVEALVSSNVDVVDGALSDYSEEYVSVALPNGLVTYQKDELMADEDGRLLIRSKLDDVDFIYDLPYEHFMQTAKIVGFVDLSKRKCLSLN